MHDHPSQEDVVRPEDLIVPQGMDVEIDELQVPGPGQERGHGQETERGEEAFLDRKETACRKLQNVLGVRGETRRMFMARPSGGFRPRTVPE